MNESEVEEHRIESGEEFLLITAKVSQVFVFVSERVQMFNCLIYELQFVNAVDLFNSQMLLMNERRVEEHRSES